MNRQDLIRTRWRADGSIRFYREAPTLPGVSEYANCSSHGIAPTIVQTGGGIVIKYHDTLSHHTHR